MPLSPDTIESTLDREAARRAKLAGLPVDAVRPYVEEETKQHPIRIEYGTPPDGAFGEMQLARVVQVGEQLTLWLNVAHPFVYRFVLGSDPLHAWTEDDEEPEPMILTAQQRSQVEVMLAVICGLSPDVDRAWYQEHLNELGRRLFHATHILMDMFEPDGSPLWSDRR